MSFTQSMGAGWHQHDQPGAMGALIEAHDWSGTELGPRRRWPDSLHSVLGLCLAAEFPLALWWGENLVQIYNDPFCRAIGAARHESGFGKPLAGAWPDIWPLLAPAVERLRAGEPSVRLSDPPVIERNGAREGAFAMSLCPFRGKGKAPGGILAMVHEAVPWESVDRLHGFLLALGEALGRLRSASERMAAGCAMLGLHMGLDRIGIAVLDADGTSGALWPDWVRSRPDGAKPAAPFRLADFGAAAVAAWAAGRPVFEAEGGEGPHASAHVPVMQQGKLAAVVFADAGPRRWTADDLDCVTRAGAKLLSALAEARLAEKGRKLRDVVDRLPALVWRSEPGGNWSWAGQQWTAFTGLSAAESLGEGWLAAFHPDDRDLLRTAWDKAERDGALLAEGRIRNRADGSFRWFRVQAAPLDAAGPARGNSGEWLGTCLDVDEIHALRDRQARLIGESQQRSRRMFGLVRALARRSAEGSSSIAEYAMQLDGRLDAFARTQAVVSMDGESAVDLDYLVAEELGAHGAHEDGVIRIEGPPVRLRLPAAQAIGLAVHELVKHAIESGALIGEGGAIRIGWKVGGSAAGRELRFEWAEEGGPAGSVAGTAPRFPLLEKMLAHEMKARTRLTSRPGGFTCRIAVPLAESIAPPGAG